LNQDFLNLRQKMNVAPKVDAIYRVLQPAFIVSNFAIVK